MGQDPCNRRAINASNQHPRNTIPRPKSQKEQSSCTTRKWNRPIPWIHMSQTGHICSGRARSMRRGWLGQCTGGGPTNSH